MKLYNVKIVPNNYVVKVNVCKIILELKIFMMNNFLSVNHLH